MKLRRHKLMVVMAVFAAIMALAVPVAVLALPA